MDDNSGANETSGVDELSGAEQLIGIGQFAMATGLSVSAVRFYANRGVLHPAEIDPRTGYRRFTEEQVSDGRLIRDLRRLEIPLSEIARAIEMSPADRRALVGHHLDELANSVERVHALAHSLGSTISPNEETIMKSDTAHAPTVGSVSLPARALGDALMQVLPAAGTDPKHPDLMTVLIEGKDGSLRIVTTDRHRLAVRDLVPAKLASNFAVVLAATTMADWRTRLDVDGDITIDVTATAATLTGVVEASARPVPTSYPDYQAVLDAPAGVSSVTADPLAIESALAGCSGPVTMRVTSSGVHVDGAEGTGHIEAFHTGPDQTVLVNPSFIRDALAATVGREVVIDITDSLQPLVIRSADDGTFTTMVMPIAPD